MKKHRAAGHKPAAKTSHHLRKIFGRFTRVQILGAVVLVAGTTLLLLLRGGEPPTCPPPTPPKSDNALASGTRVAKENEPSVKGANRPPVVTAVLLSPNVVFPGVAVRAVVKASDPDQDDVGLLYTWKKNGEVVVEQSGEEFDTTGMHRGELLTVSVLPDDGKESGKALDSNGILIQNRSPEITSLPSAGVSSGHFSYQVIAKDPDNDPLLFSLEEAPPGMTINLTGLIEWNVPRGLQGKQQVRLIVSDGSASSFQAFNLNLGERAAQ